MASITNRETTCDVCGAAPHAAWCPEDAPPRDHKTIAAEARAGVCPCCVRSGSPTGIGEWECECGARWTGRPPTRAGGGRIP